MKQLKICSTIFLLFLASELSAQIPAVAAGLAFSSGIDVNSLTTGNPAIYAKVYFKINKQLKIVPGLTAFSVQKKFYPADDATLKNYMFQADCDFHYSLYREDPLRLVGIAGINTTSVISKWDISQTQNVENKTGIGLGLNLGGAINMFVSNYFDAFISGKYIAGKYSQFVINVGIIYYAEGLRRKGGW